MQDKTPLLMPRREMLTRCGVGFGAAALHAMLQEEPAMGANPLLPKKPHFPGRAKHVIHLFMNGGPSQVDTFDPKPDAGHDYCGPFDKVIPTNVDGIRISAQLPLLAQQADKYAIIRSMTHGINAHETASYIVQTGRRPGRLVYPSVGAVVSRFKRNFRVGLDLISRAGGIVTKLPKKRGGAEVDLRNILNVNHATSL